MTLVVVHLFYVEFWPELAECIRNVGPCDVVVTCQDEQAAEVARRDFPDARFLQVENCGFDVWPFFRALQTADLSRYDVIVKLHTKRDCEANFNGRTFCGGEWREALLGFCRTPEAWRKTLARLADATVGMVAGHGVIVHRNIFPRGRLRQSFDRAQQKVEELSGKSAAGGSFVAGTMFAAKPAVFDVLRPSFFSAADFPVRQYHTVETFAHRCERMLGLAVRASGLKLVSFDQGLFAMAVEIRWHIVLSALRRFFYQRKVTNSGHLVVKVCKLMVWRRKVRPTHQLPLSGVIRYNVRT